MGVRLPWVDSRDQSVGAGTFDNYGDSAHDFGFNAGYPPYPKYPANQPSDPRSPAVYPANPAFPAVTVDANGLSLRTKRESYTDIRGVVHSYTSGAVQTDRSFAQTYGYFETNFQLATEAGIDSAFWLYTRNSSSSQNLPGITELDVIEEPAAPYYINSIDYNGDLLSNNVHTSPGVNLNLQASPTADLIPYGSPLGAMSHTYGIDWEPGVITDYLDGNKIRSYTYAVPSGQQPMYMILNQELSNDAQIGGNWFGDPDSLATYQTIFAHARWVKAWTQSAEAPYPSLPSFPGTVQAANYDTGGPGISYNQSRNAYAQPYYYSRSDNNGAAFSNYADGSTPDGITSASTGQWYKYTVNVATAGTYNLSFAVNTNNHADAHGNGVYPYGGRMHLEDWNTATATGTQITDEFYLNSPQTSGTWWPLTKTNGTPIHLTAGTHVFRWVQDLQDYSDDFNLYSMTATLVQADYGVTNGSFETPVVQYPADGTYIPSGDPRLTTSGWSFTGISGIIANGGKLGNPNAPDGVQAAYVQPGGTVSQSVAFTTGGFYTLTLQAEEAYWDSPQKDGTSHPVQVLVDGASVGTFNPQIGWYTQGTFTFGVTAGSHTITLQGLSSDGSYFSDFVDKVTLAPAAVPTVANGSFETPVVQYPADGTFIPSGDPRLAASGWNFTGVSGIIANGGKLANPTSPDGVQAAYVQPGGTVSQSVAFAAPGYYTLSLLVAEAYWDTSAHPVQVLVDGASAGTFTPGLNYYAQGSFTFGVTAGSHTITLQGLSSDGSYFSDFVDLVTVTPAVGAMSGAMFSGPAAAPMAHLAGFDRLTADRITASRITALAGQANPPTAAFDSNVGTFFDSAQSSGGYVGLTLTAARSVSSISFAPRVGYEKRMDGGVFEGSNTSATAGYTTLATVTATPKDGTGKTGLTNTLTVTNHTAFKWLRYRGPSGGYCDIAEIQFLH